MGQVFTIEPPKTVRGEVQLRYRDPSQHFDNSLQNAAFMSVNNVCPFSDLNKYV